jgi:hypothetical protein
VLLTGGTGALGAAVRRRFEADGPGGLDDESGGLLQSGQRSDA